MKPFLAITLFATLAAAAVSAQFTGPSQTGRPATVQEARDARLGTYVTVTGNIVAHIREDYYTFRDETGEIRVEISPRLWRDRKVAPETKVRLVAEVDRGIFGRYLSVQSLDIVE